MMSRDPLRVMTLARPSASSGLEGAEGVGTAQGEQSTIAGVVYNGAE